MTITILGTGYVGLTTATVLAHSGHTVYAVEPNTERLEVIKTGRSFFYEKGLDPLVAAAVKNGSLIPTDSYEPGVPKSDIVFSCVGTPDNPDGSSNLAYVYASAKEAASLMQTGTVYVQKSTVPVGTGEKLERIFSATNKDIAYISNPEFLREACAVEDSLYFDRVVVGGKNQAAIEKVMELSRIIEKKRDAIVKLAGINAEPMEGKYIATRLNSAELIKVTSNAFLALKISFANSIAKLADKTGADIKEVMDAVGADPRINRAFLNAGRGFGGGCFPKDVSGLIASGLEHGVDLDIMQAAQVVNESMPGYILEKLLTEMNAPLKNKKVAVLGLAFKAGTSDARRSPGIKIANIVQRAGAQVTAYDPEAAEEAGTDLKSDVMVATNIEQAVKAADAVIIATDWPQFLHYDLAKLAKSLNDRYFVDAVNAFDIPEVEKVDLKYIGVGRNGARS